MNTINDVFVVHRARSALFDTHEPGDIPFISHSAKFGGVIGYVEPMPPDMVFQFNGITVSSFCEAQVHVPPFIADGRSGNGLVVLEPRSNLNQNQLAFAASYINLTLKWRFSWYKQTTADRIRRMPFGMTALPEAKFPVMDLLPSYNIGNKEQRKTELEYRLFGSVSKML